MKNLGKDEAIEKQGAPLVQKRVDEPKECYVNGMRPQGRRKGLPGRGNKIAAVWKAGGGA